MALNHCPTAYASWATGTLAFLMALVCSSRLACGFVSPSYDHYVDGADLYMIADTQLIRPGVQHDINFDYVGAASINNRGQVLFNGSGDIVQGTIPIDAEFLGQRGQPIKTLVAYSDPPPGDIPLLVLINDTALDDRGRALTTIAFHNLDPSGPDPQYDEGIWRFDGTGWGNPLATVPGPAIGVGAGGMYGHFGISTPSTSPSGYVLLKAIVGAEYLGYGSDEGIWVADPDDNIRFIIRGGMEVPTNAGPAVIFGSPFLRGSEVDDTGRAVFVADLAGDNIDQSNEHGIWASHPSGDLQLVVQSGQTAPGTEPMTVFSEFFNMSLNSEGETLLMGLLEGPAIDSSNNTGYWVHRDDGQLEKVLRIGDLVPGSTDRYIKSINPPPFSESGTTVAIVEFEDQLDQSVGFSVLAVDRQGHTWPILDAEAEVPGDTTGAKFQHISNIAVNRYDQVAFEARLTGPDISSANDTGVWATDPNGNLVPILREGDMVAFSDTDIRTVQHVFVDLTLHSAGAIGFNDRGELALEARFTDGSHSVLISYAAAIPEPSSIVLTIIGIAMVGGACKFRRRPSMPRSSNS